MSASTPLWQKDGPATEDWITRFTVGDDPGWDTLLLPYDIRATRVHVQGLAEIDVVSAGELADVEGALDDLLEQVDTGAVQVTTDDEDCHTVIENYLTEKLGATGKKIHAGRSRNDQVLAALRLFLRERLRRFGAQTVELGRQLCMIGEQHDGDLMPGYTHMQRAMPSTVGCWVLGFAEVLTADLETLEHAYQQVNVSPLGSAAGYGVPHLELPREMVAERLGFRSAHLHPTSVQLTRGKLELLVVNSLAQVAATVNRLASDLVLYSTAEYGFVNLPEAYTTGSSIMPQKRNPDVLELARAAYHHLLADAHKLAAIPANLPSGYHRDLQPTKAAVMGSMLRSADLLTAINAVMSGLEFDTERMRDACTPELFATAHALKAVRDGVPFREAYQKAATELDALETPPAAEALSAYRVDGYPGQGRPDIIEEQLAQHSIWIEGNRAP